jgi:hypothetical protein
MIRRSHTDRPLFRTVAVAGLSLALVSGLAACGDDDDAADDPPAVEQAEGDGTTSPEGSEPQTDAPDGSTVAAEACEAQVGLNAAVAGMPEDPAEIGPYLTDEVVPLAATVRDETEGETGAAAAQVHAGYEAVAESGDPSGLEDPIFTEAQATVGHALHDGCEWETLDVEATEYSFGELPESLPAGPVSIALANTGAEEHELVLFRRADDATETFEEISQLPEEEQAAKMQFTGFTYGGPETTTYLAADLEPGTYFFVCFLPTGGEEDGEPHFLHGMHATVEVA